MKLKELAKSFRESIEGKTLVVDRTPGEDDDVAFDEPAKEAARETSM